jgi:hypothetical protein
LRNLAKSELRNWKLRNGVETKKLGEELSNFELRSWELRKRVGIEDLGGNREDGS